MQPFDRDAAVIGGRFMGEDALGNGTNLQPWAPPEMSRS